MPADVNANGDIFGGWVMAQVDLAGAVIPARHVDGRMATVAVNQFIFKQPVRVGDILSFFAGITRIGNTSITVQVEVYAERFRAQGQIREGHGSLADLRGHRRGRKAAAYPEEVRCHPGLTGIHGAWIAGQARNDSPQNLPCRPSPPAKRVAPSSPSAMRCLLRSHSRCSASGRGRSHC